MVGICGIIVSDIDHGLLKPRTTIVINTITPTLSMPQRILKTYDPNLGLQNFFAKAILIVVFVTSAIIIAIVAVREEIP